MYCKYLIARIGSPPTPAVRMATGGNGPTSPKK